MVPFVQKACSLWMHTHKCLHARERALTHTHTLASSWLIFQGKEISQARVILSLRGHLAMSMDILGFYSWGWRSVSLLLQDQCRPGKLLNIPQSPGWPPSPRMIIVSNGTQARATRVRLKVDVGHKKCYKEWSQSEQAGENTKMEEVLYEDWASYLKKKSSTNYHYVSFWWYLGLKPGLQIC